ncbi:hypothetical protein L1887_37410 [Cichorium endivia]|nr:hypothetical protein L1887_37410 [Cichorium endivia]
MALAVTSSTSIVFSSSNRTVQGVQPSSSNFQPSDRSYRSPTSLYFSRKRSVAVKAPNGEPKRNDSIVSSAEPAFAPVLAKRMLKNLHVMTFPSNMGYKIIGLSNFQNTKQSRI